MKTRRNDPCHCGSGKKYKKCCLPKDEAAAARLQPSPPSKNLFPFVALEGQLDKDSNRVVDLIDAGKLDEAEAAAHALVHDYPDMHDGLERLGMVYEARGDYKRAADYYRRTVAFMESHDGYDVELVDSIRSLADKLENQEHSSDA